MTDEDRELTQDQINRIKLLLSDKQYDSEEFFALLNNIISKLWLDPDKRKINVAKKHSQQLQELAIKAESILNDFKQVEPSLVREMSSLSTVFLACLIEPNKKHTSLKTVPIDDVYRELAQSVKTVARSVEHYYSSSKWEKALSTFHNIWYTTIGETPTVSESSAFIGCLSIIVDIDSETIKKAAERSEWYRDLKAFKEHKSHIRGQTSEKSP